MKDLNKMFKPDSVAVIGASNTPGKVGYIIIDNIISGGYNGKVYPINPKGGEIQGLKAYENIKSALFVVHTIYWHAIHSRLKLSVCE